MDIWEAAQAGDLAEVERLAGQDPGLLDSREDPLGRTPLGYASREGHMGVVRWLLDAGAAIDGQDLRGDTALGWACSGGHLPVVKLLLERGADPTIADESGLTPLMDAITIDGRLEIVHLLLDQQRVKDTINHRDDVGKTALNSACYFGRVGEVRALLESGADPTIATNSGRTPRAAAEEPFPDETLTEGRRECVAALKVRSCLLFLLPSPGHPALLISWLRLRSCERVYGGRRRSGPICSARPGRWQMGLRALQRR
jgi:ankyrin repeat protein